MRPNAGTFHVDFVAMQGDIVDPQPTLRSLSQCQHPQCRTIVQQGNTDPRSLAVPRFCQLHTASLEKTA